MVNKYDYLGFTGIDTFLRPLTEFITSPLTLFEKNKILVALEIGWLEILDFKGNLLNRIQVFNEDESEDNINIEAIKVYGHLIICMCTDVGVKILNSSQLTTIVESRQINCCELLDDKLILGMRDGSLQIRDLKGVLLTMLTGHTRPVTCIKIHKYKDNIHIISGSEDATLRVWNLSGVCLATLRGHTRTIKCITTFDNVIVSGSEDYYLKVWVDFKEQTTFADHQNTVNDVKIMKIKKFNGEYTNLIISVSEDGTLKVWNDYNIGSHLPVAFMSSKVYDEYFQTLEVLGTLVLIHSNHDEIKILDVEHLTTPITLKGTRGGKFIILSDNRIFTASPVDGYKIWE